MCCGRCPRHAAFTLSLLIFEIYVYTQRRRAVRGRRAVQQVQLPMQRIRMTHYAKKVQSSAFPIKGVM